MTVRSRHIAVVGGGTAGWLAALVLQKAYAKQSKSDGNLLPQISVIESPNIPTVGVGEGSTSILRQILLDLDFDEEEFLRETKATIKYGICHKDWGRQTGSYFGPIDDPNQLVPPPAGSAGSWLHTAMIASGKPVQDAHLFSYLMKQKKSPFARKQNGELIPISQFHYAYHFDQAKFGRYLATKADGIEHINAEVCDVVLDSETGNIIELEFRDHDRVEVDFIIDCTGFRREIINRLGGQWHSYSDILPLNKAMPFWLEHEGEYSPFTLAQALSSGWMWNIPTQERIGCGYVFTDAHQSPEDAQSEIEATIGKKIEPRGLISINPGRQKQAWISNCVSMGLAQSFLEPLEATSIHGTLVQILLLTQTSGQDLVSNNTQSARDLYNNTVAGQVDDYAHFINLHYAGGRSDTPFWQEMTANGITKTVQDRLKSWLQKPVERSDFPKFPTSLPHVEEQLHIPVLDGLGLLPKEPSRIIMAATPKNRMLARKSIEQLTKEFKSAAHKAIGHREYLEGLS